MHVKIAVASSNGTTVNEHFGKAREFRIYRIVGDEYEFLETRKGIPACEGQVHDNERLLKAAEALSDCRGVVAAQVGAGAIDALISYRIMAFTLPGTISEAIETLISTKRFAYLQGSRK